jgi:hypothetical protein
MTVRTYWIISDNYSGGNYVGVIVEVHINGYRLLQVFGLDGTFIKQLNAIGNVKVNVPNAPL